MTADVDPRDTRLTDLNAQLERLPPAAVSRRRFIELLGASLALAGAAACAPPRETIVPYVRQPDNITPGTPRFYASAFVLDGLANGVLVESHLGRPTKIEGNPLHPSSLGATDVFTQAAILSLYSPSRSQAVTDNGHISTWVAFVEALRAAIDRVRPANGDGLRILSEPGTSPTLAAQRQALGTLLPNARWHTWSPTTRAAVRAGTRQAFGRPLDPRYAFDRADIVLLLDADPFTFGPASVRYARDLAQRRRPERGPMNRLYAIESTLTPIGASADHRLPLRARDVLPLTLALARGLGVQLPTTLQTPGPEVIPADWLAALTDDLRAHASTALVVAGDGQPASVHALAHALNATLGSVGTTVQYADPLDREPVDDDPTASLRALVDDMSADRVQALLILGGNPVYTAPADIPFASALARVPFRAHLNLFEDETAALCQWHIPQLHWLESWGDARAYDGTITIQQPLIAPLYAARSAYEILAAIEGGPEISSHDAVKEYWRTQRDPATFDTFWQTTLHDGVVADSATPPVAVTLTPGWADSLDLPARTDDLELVIRPDPALYDGQFAHNSWLLEVPRPLTTLTWDNVAFVSANTASQHGIRHGQIVELRADTASIRAPAWILPGQPDGSIAVTLGYGRTRGAGPGTKVGFDAGPLRTSRALWIRPGISVSPTSDNHPFATTQDHYAIEGRDLARSIDASELSAARPAAESNHASLYPAYQYAPNSWGMVIDSSACLGCNACIVACVAENNIPTVGRDQVARGRDMLWLRLDTYYGGADANPTVERQLVPCMHCENAPCELVCPVGATVHSADALNDMVYNRCVGTRYCSNNCPYKVRHFNFFQYADYDTPTLKLLHNPEVTVRSRGVMEKCTYCVQRIRAAEITAGRENRAIQDGEVQTACQAACPSGAIVFGNLNDPRSQVVAARVNSRNYTLLDDLNTRPHTTYLSRVRNPHPGLERA